MSVTRGRPAVCRKGRIVEYRYGAGSPWAVSEEMKQVFDYDGCLLVRGFFTKDEMDLCNSALLRSDEIKRRAYEIPDGTGRKMRMVLWRKPGNDVTGMMARCNKMVTTCEELLGGEVYHFSAKVMMKMPRTGGRHLWHQDYGYWYPLGCLRPDMLTAYIALDHCVKENGCLQVAGGSHRVGRIQHDLISGQTQANPERVSALLKQFPVTAVHMEPGDCLFFHSNVLHTADKNDSDMRRWAFLVAYNRRDNDPIYTDQICQNYTPINRVANSEIMTCDPLDMSGKDFLNPKEDKTVKAEEVTTDT